MQDKPGGGGTQRLMMDRTGMFAGIVFFGLILAASISAPSLPDSNLPVDQYAAIYARDQSGHLTSTFLSAFAGLAFLYFLAGLLSVVVRNGGDDIALSALMALSGLAAIAMILIAQSIYAATAIAAGTSGVSPGFVRGLDTVVPAITLYSGIPRAAFLIAASVAVVRHGIAPRWLELLGAIAAFASLIGMGAIFSLDGPLIIAGFLSMVLFALWVLVAGVAILIQERKLQVPDVSISAQST